MTRANTWARHYQNVWLERAGDPELPPWLRVASLAYGSHQANGHALFSRGNVALVLGKVDPHTGEVVAMDRRAVHRAIGTAVHHGWLASGSKARCLIVPAHAIAGPLGDPDAPCPQHERRGGS